MVARHAISHRLSPLLTPWSDRIRRRFAAREMTIGQSFPSPNQPDKGRIAAYRAGLGLDSWVDDRCTTIVCTTIVGNRGSHLGHPG
jgi:hypothetical protein